jgi:hypothetical protein
VTANGKEKQGRQNDRSQEASREGVWWKRAGQKPSGRSWHHENLEATLRIVAGWCETTPHGTAARHNERSGSMSIGTILLIVLILILVGALPTWPHSKSWGYYPSGGLGLVVLILLVLVLMGRL